MITIHEEWLDDLNMYVRWTHESNGVIGFSLQHFPDGAPFPHPPADQPIYTIGTLSIDGKLDLPGPRHVSFDDIQDFRRFAGVVSHIYQIGRLLLARYYTFDNTPFVVTRD